MYGKWVTLNLGENIECRVFVLCTPATPLVELQEKALAILRGRLAELTTP